MIVGGHTLELYCDTPGCENFPRSAIPTPLACEFTGESGGECRREARRYGWKIDLRTGQAWCPWCTGKKRLRGAGRVTQQEANALAASWIKQRVSNEGREGLHAGSDVQRVLRSCARVPRSGSAAG